MDLKKENNNNRLSSEKAFGLEGEYRFYGSTVLAKGKSCKSSLSEAGFFELVFKCKFSINVTKMSLVGTSKCRHGHWYFRINSDRRCTKSNKAAGR